MSALRYVTSTYIGTWAMDKMGRYCVLPNGGEPFLYYPLLLESLRAARESGFEAGVVTRSTVPIRTASASVCRTRSSVNVPGAPGPLCRKQWSHWCVQR